MTIHTETKISWMFMYDGMSIGHRPSTIDHWPSRNVSASFSWLYAFERFAEMKIDKRSLFVKCVWSILFWVHTYLSAGQIFSIQNVKIHINKFIRVGVTEKKKIENVVSIQYIECFEYSMRLTDTIFCNRIEKFGF